MPETKPTKTSESALGFLVTIGLGILFLAVKGCVMSVWRSGYVPHVKTVSVHYFGDWLPGEYKECSEVRKNPPKDLEIAGLDCPQTMTVGGSTHTVDIQFWGDTERPDVSVEDEYSDVRLQWRCKRSSDSFACYALN